MTDKTIGQLEAIGFTHVECNCVCRRSVSMPFRLLRIKYPRVPLSLMTLAELAAKLVCERCGKREFTFRPSVLPGTAKPH